MLRSRHPATRRRARVVGDDVADTLCRAGDGAFVIGADGVIALWNPAAGDILGYSAAEAVGRPCCDVFAEFDAGGTPLCYPGCAVTDLLRWGDPVQSFDVRARTKSGRVVWLHMSVLVIGDGVGDECLTIHLFRDVTATRDLLARIEDRLAAEGTAVPAPVSNGHRPLTRREREVLRLIARGLNTSTAAAQLRVSRATVRNHVQNIFAKLGVHNRPEAVAHAVRHRLLWSDVTK